MNVTLNLVVIRAVELERSLQFYEALGLRFSRARPRNEHGWEFHSSLFLPPF